MHGLPHFLHRESQAFYWILEALCIIRPRQGLHATVFLQYLLLTRFSLEIYSRTTTAICRSKKKSYMTVLSVLATFPGTMTK